MRTALLALSLLASTPLAASSSYLAALPAGRIKVDVMKTVTAPRPADASMKLQAAAVTGDRDRNLWQLNAQRSESGEPLEAWQQRLALTDPRTFAREEQNALRQPAADVLYEKTGEAAIQLVPTADGRLMIQADDLPELSGIVFDPAGDSIETPFGRTAEVSEVSSNPDLMAPGAWSGTQWQLDAPGDEPGTGTSVKVAIGRMSDDRVVLSYEAKQVESGKMPRRASSLVVFQR